MLRIIRKTLLVMLTLLFFGCAWLGVWLWNLNSWLTTQLAEKRFFAPTEYWSAPLRIRNGEFLPIAQFIKNLQEREYQALSWGTALKPGTYWRGGSEECKDLNALECVLFRPFDRNDPNLTGQQLAAQGIAWPQNSGQVETWAGAQLARVEAILLEPQLFLRVVADRPVRQEWASLGAIPPACLQAVLAIEDHNFLEHQGISPVGILRALATNVLTGRKAQGGSTITQQTVKNSFLTPEKTWQRKWKEFWMAILLELHQNKDAILETYLNIIYMGQAGPFEIRGFPAASLHYFDKPIAELEWQECALLAGLLNSPGLFDPFRHPDRSKQRRDKVIDKLTENGVLDEQTRQQLLNSQLGVKKSSLPHATLPYYVDKVRREFPEASETPGMRFFLGAQMPWQESAQLAIQSSLAELRKKDPSLQGLALAMDLETRWVHLAIGGGSFRESQFNRALDAKRQIGSLIKPLLTAFYFQQNPDARAEDLVQDSPLEIKVPGSVWRPQNYDRKFRGTVPLYEALAFSYNLPFVSLFESLGEARKDFPEFLIRGGLQSEPFAPVPALSLGAIDMHPIEVMNLYATLANQGQVAEPIWVRGIYDLNGNSWVYLPESETEQVWDAKASRRALNLMEQAVKIGTARTLESWQGGLAAKTGTTSDSRDAWFVGIAGHHILLTWVGPDTQTQITQKLSGARTALPIWLATMSRLFPEQRVDQFLWKPSESFHEVEWQNQTLYLLD